MGPYLTNIDQSKCRALIASGNSRPTSVSLNSDAFGRSIFEKTTVVIAGPTLGLIALNIVSVSDSHLLAS